MRQIPVDYLRLAGVYDDNCSNAFLPHQISRVYMRSPKTHAYPGELKTRQSFLHLDGLADAVLRLLGWESKY